MKENYDELYNKLIDTLKSYKIIEYEVIGLTGTISFPDSNVLLDIFPLDCPFHCAYAYFLGYYNNTDEWREGTPPYKFIITDDVMTIINSIFVARWNQKALSHDKIARRI